MIILLYVIVLVETRFVKVRVFSKSTTGVALGSGRDHRVREGPQDEGDHGVSESKCEISELILRSHSQSLRSQSQNIEIQSRV